MKKNTIEWPADWNPSEGWGDATPEQIERLGGDPLVDVNQDLAQKDEMFAVEIFELARRLYGPTVDDEESPTALHHVARILVREACNVHIHRDDGEGWSGFVEAAARTIVKGMGDSLIADEGFNEAGREQLLVAM